MRVAEVMTEKPVTVGPDDLLKDAARAMVVTGVSGLPVTDEGGRVVGILTEADFVMREARRGRRRRLLDAWFAPGALVPAQRVGEVMSRRVVTVRPDDSLTEAARRMVSQGVKRLPVVDDAGILVGIISRADVMRAIARADESIAADVRDLLRSGVVTVDAEAVDVVVQDGVVRLTGQVDTHSDAVRLQALVGLVGGVLRVEADLRWKVDDHQPGVRWPGYSQEGADDGLEFLER